MKKFSFGDNWLSYSRGITEEMVCQATRALAHLLDETWVQGKTVIDVGCGSGLSTLAFLRLGASQVYAIDIDAQCVRLTQQIVPREQYRGRVSVRCLSVLDPTLSQQLPLADVVYAWGSLHHTGAMWQALAQASSLVAPGGFLAIALYNRHWTSPLWRRLKIVYNHVPVWLQEAAVLGYSLLGCTYNHLARRTIITRRGMDVIHDIRDWLGGYPYEYASPQEVQTFARTRSWEVVKVMPCQGMTGCNEFVFQISTC
jgi:2-polyprenyl-6-hydroxyphenyl methylase/3-demethylubiquinone-9 3-methyltransferase